MKKTLLIGNKYFQYFTLIIALLTLPFFKGISQVSLTTLGAAYTQNFDGLVNSGTSSSVPTGWAFSETGSNANATYAAGTGTGNSGETFSFGASASTDRAFGSLASSSLLSKVGASFVNNTGSLITSLNISYVGEEWRLGVTGGRTDQLNFEYSLNATSLTSGTWLPVTALNFVTPNTSTVVGAVNGNLTGNKSSISSTINSLAIAVGGTVWVRWSDADITGADDGLGIDDFSLTPSGSAPVPPTKLVITAITPGTPIAGSGFSVTVQAQDATNTAQNVVANTAFVLTTNGNAGAIGGTIVGTINAGSNSVVVSGVTLATGGTNVNLTATKTSGDLLSAGTSATFSVTGLATHLAFVSVPSSGYISSNIAAFTVEARRADNSIDVNYTGNITVSKASGPGSLSGTVIVAAVAGVATFSTLQFDQVGTYSLSTTASGLTPATSSAIIISPSPAMWDFTTAAPTGVPANLSISNMLQGNNNGTTTMITSGSASSGYTGVSGGNNAGAAARTGGINTGANGSAYFEFTLTPDANYVVTLNGMSFGSRSTGTGPAAFSIRSSVQNFTTNIGSGSLLTSSTWALSNPSISSTSSNAGSPVTFRIYGHSGSGGAQVSTANWRIDDVLLNLSVTSCSQPNISVNSGSICSGNSFTIAPTGGITYSVTGTNFTVSPTSTTSYTVTGADAIGCTNTAISAVTVNTVPAISVNSGAICAGDSFTISPNGASTYTVSGGAFIVSPTTATDYTVTGTSAQGCLSSNQAVSSVSVNALPSITITGASTVCSGYSTTLTASGANTYVWSNGPTTDMNVVSPSTNTGYTVVGTDGNACSASANINITTSLCVPNTSLQAVYCGSTLSTLSDRLKCIAVLGASKYEWQVTDIVTNSVYVIQSFNNLVDMYLSYIPQVTYNKSYSIKVRAYSGGIWGAFSNACNVTTPLNSVTKLQTVYCSTTLSSLNDKLQCELVPNTTKYEWEVTDLSASAVYTIQSTGSNNNIDMYLSYIPQITYNKSYSIRVRAYSGGIWGAFGTACTINTPASASTKLQTVYCGTTLITLNDKLKCDLVAAATKYEWEVTDIATATPYLKQSSGTGNNIDMYLSYIPQVTYNKTYSIRVRAYSAGVWGTFGTSCTVTTPVQGGTARFALSDYEETEIGSSISVNAYPNPTTDILNIDFDIIPANASVEVYNMVGELVLTQQLSTLNNTINTTQLSNGLFHAKVIGNNKLLYAQKIVKQ
jgi:hypothetical protein